MTKVTKQMKVSRVCALVVALGALVGCDEQAANQQSLNCGDEVPFTAAEVCANDNAAPGCIEQGQKVSFIVGQDEQWVLSDMAGTEAYTLADANDQTVLASAENGVLKVDCQPLGAQATADAGEVNLNDAEQSGDVSDELASFVAVGVGGYPGYGWGGGCCAPRCAPYYPPYPCYPYAQPYYNSSYYYQTNWRVFAGYGGGYPGYGPYGGGWGAPGPWGGPGYGGFNGPGMGAINGPGPWN
jgi:hypothetical protein